MELLGRVWREPSSQFQVIILVLGIIRFHIQTEEADYATWFFLTRGLHQCTIFYLDTKPLNYLVLVRFVGK